MAASVGPVWQWCGLARVLVCWTPRSAVWSLPASWARQARIGSREVWGSAGGAVVAPAALHGDPAGSAEWDSPRTQAATDSDTRGQPGADKTGPPSPGPVLRCPVHTPSLAPDVHGGLARGQTRSCPGAAGLCLASTLSSGETEHRAPPDEQRILGKSITPGVLGNREIRALRMLGSEATSASPALSLPIHGHRTLFSFREPFPPFLIRKTYMGCPRHTRGESAHDPGLARAPVVR